MELHTINKFIVITSINEPTTAVKSFSQLKDYKTLVIGDSKTPEDWNFPGVMFISLKEQENISFNLSKLLPLNHYCRKMIGYLHAIKSGAEIIVDTDDDNIPKKDWGFPVYSGEFNSIVPNQGFVNIYSLFTKQRIWPRGLPLGLINSNIDSKKNLVKTQCKVGVWQGLADESPDVDAIYRLTDNLPCIFDENEPIVLDVGNVCPFNSQNTAIIKELFPLLYLPCFVTFRFCDILRGLIAQPIMWLYGYRLGFTKATVTQIRNEHDYYEDFISEIPMYQYSEKVFETTDKSISSSRSITDNLVNSYEGLQREGIVQKEELETLKAWLEDIS